MIYGGFWVRSLAAIVDGIIVSVIVWALSIPVSSMLGVDVGQDFSTTIFNETQYGKMLNAQVLQELLIYLAVILGLSTVIMGAYDAILPATYMMSTPGKLMFGYVITDMNGQKLSMGHAFKRHGAKVLSASIVVGFFWPLFTENKQALHDIIAKTLVVKRGSY